MSQILETLMLDEAISLAKDGKIRNARRLISALVALRVDTLTIKRLHEEVGLVYLRNRSARATFGVVREYDFRIATIFGDEYSACIGLSTDSFSTFRVKDPVFHAEGDSHETLFKFGKRWHYVNFCKHGTYGGLVIHASGGIMRVVPLFDIKAISATALKCIKALNGKGVHRWELPSDFLTSPSEYSEIQEKQTALALQHYGL